ncbi:hypothetical protein jhhlp_004655 [Lomentospora prolificans]|uniref:Peroxin 11C n=1 Tax=Lomentospora prolificans TaxID=41688 RepID=A0A2N3NC63_9PEZI|nr:hypothetical protein jhhlp_004655 [Lomentospora prolificans]
MSSSPGKSSPASKALKLPLSVILALTPSNIDAFLSHLHRCIQTPSGIDTILLFVCYSSRLSASILESAAQGTLEQYVRRLLALVPLASTQAAATKAVAVAEPSARSLAALRTSGNLRALSALLSDVRTFSRLWGLLNMYMGLKRLVAREIAVRRSDKTKGAAGNEELLDRVIAWTQLLTGASFQVLENAAYLGSKQVLNLAPATQMKAMQWSVRFWAASTGIEIGRLLIEKVRKERGDITTAEHQEWRAAWNRSLARNLAWAPLTVHWSMEKGFVNDFMIGALATIPGIIQITQLWKTTA